MKIRMLTSIAGNADERYGIGDFSFAPGDTPDVHKTLAGAWIANGYAEKIKSSTADAPQAAAPAAITTVQEGA